MPKLRIAYLLSGLILMSSLGFSNIKVSSYGVDSAIKTTAAGVRPHSNVIATSTNNKLNVLGFWFVNSGVTYSDDVVVMRVAFNNFLFDSVDGMTVKDINMLSDVVAELQSPPLFYPSPFRFSNINRDTKKAGSTLYFTTTKQMDIEIQMYDIFGRRIWTKDCPVASTCGQAGVNKIEFNKDALNGYEMSAGVYFYLFIHEGEVIYRGKVAVVP
jgi:hypothetical protein